MAVPLSWQIIWSPTGTHAPLSPTPSPTAAWPTRPLSCSAQYADGEVVNRPVALTPTFGRDPRLPWNYRRISSLTPWRYSWDWLTGWSGQPASQLFREPGHTSSCASPCQRSKNDKRQALLRRRVQITFATELADAGVSVYTLMKLLGHDSMVTSQRYVSAAGAETRSAAAQNTLYTLLGTKRRGADQGGQQRRPR